MQMDIDTIEQEFDAQEFGEQEFGSDNAMDANLARTTVIKPTATAILIPTLTQQARARLQYLQQAAPDKRLRIRVKAGGCSGFQYEFLLEDYQAQSDAGDLQKYADSAAELLIDITSLGFLQRAIIDYQTNLAGESFSIINPEATSSCGCGVSFSM